MTSQLFADATAALEDAHAYPMFSREYRAGVQRAHQLFTQFTATAEPGEDMDVALELSGKLAEFLAVRWEELDAVEVRYEDGSTEVLRLATDPQARERFRSAVSARTIELEEED